ncbi:hypothetical protein HQ34_07490 [Porphyromonas cangingivalis]|nr:hypothetical protein HQ34_07490 [Porphyromonas cangingivalis]
MAMAMAAALVAAPGCKDYDDDINNLREQMAQTSKSLGDKISKLENDLKAVDAKADAAQKAAEKAWADAQAADEAIKKELTDLAKKLQEEADKAAAKAAELGKEIKELAVRVAALESTRVTKTEFNAAVERLEKLIGDTKTELLKKIDEERVKLETKISEAEQRLNEAIAALDAKVQLFVGHRITSIVRIPEYVNGVEAVWFKTMAYLKGKHDSFNSNHVKYGYVNGLSFADYQAKLPERELWNSSSSLATAYFTVNPSNVVEGNFTQAYIDSWVTQNILTRAEGRMDNPLRNAPIKPVDGQEYKVKNGVLAVHFVKTVPDLMGSFLKPHDLGRAEKFHAFKLTLPFAKAVWTDEEKRRNELDPTFVPSVSSEALRIEEIPYYPRIKNLLASNTYNEWQTSYNPANGAADPEVLDYRPYVLDKKGRPIHFSDSVILYQSVVNKLIDVEVDWKKGDDLMKYVEVSVEDLQNGPEQTDKYYNFLKKGEYQDYNLAFRFYLAKGKYYQGTNQTDQQEFAVVTPEGRVTSRVYDDPNGETKTAVGREPIIRVELYDKNTGVTVDQRYIKIKFVEKTEDFVLPEIVFEDRYVECDSIRQTLGTRQMNLLVYRKLEEYGISKDAFHKIYPEYDLEYLKKDGDVIVEKGSPYFNKGYYNHINTVNFIAKPNPNDNTTYNFMWDLGVETVGTIKMPERKSKFELVIRFKSTVSGKGDILIPFTYSIMLPTQDFKYQGTYWSEGAVGEVFKVNPLVYNTAKNGADGTLAGRSHISADLVNGYIYKNNKKPENLNQLVRMLRGCGDVRFEFAKERFAAYPHLAGYEVNDGKDALWEGTPGTVLMDDLDGMQAPKYVNDPKLAATIHNRFGVTAASNKSTELSYPWSFDESIGRDEDKAIAIIALHELDDQKGTDPARELVGKKVPVNMMVKYNDYNVVSEHEFEVFFINPLTLQGGTIGNFKDAEIDGSVIRVDNLYKYQDWNYQIVKQGGAAPQNALYNYYAVQVPKFDVENVKTNLKLIDNVLMPTEGVTDGPLPTGRSLEVGYSADNTGKTFQNNDPRNTHLRWVNNNGTPVNLKFRLFFNAVAEYKWGKINFDLTNEVIPAKGTDDNNP